MALAITSQEQHSLGNLYGASATATFGSLGVRSVESLQNGGFKSFTGWSVANGFAQGTGNHVFTEAGSGGTLTQTSANLTVAGVNAQRYIFTYTISAVTDVGTMVATITTAFGDSAVSLNVATAGTRTVSFLSDAAASSADFVISVATGTTDDSFTIDNISLKPVGYTTGGETLVPGDVGLGQFVGPVDIIEGEDGYIFKWDAANEKILVYEAALETGTIATPAFTGDAQTVTSQVPFLVEEESLASASDIVTLAYAPAYIVSISDSTGVTYRIIPSAAAPADDVSCAVNFTTGVITFHANDDPSAVRVTYFPSRLGTFLDNANAVEETLTASAGSGVNSTSRAALIQYVYNNTTPGLEFIEPTGEAASTGGNIQIDINNSTATTYISHADEATDILAVRYLNHSALEPGMTWVDDGDVSCSSGDKDYSGVAGLNGEDLLHVPALGNMVVGEETGSGNENAVWGDSGTTEADNVATWEPKTNLWSTSISSPFVTFAMAHVLIDLNALVPPQPVPSLVTGTIAALTFVGGGASVLTQVASLSDLSSVVVGIFARGR